MHYHVVEGSAQPDRTIKNIYGEKIIDYNKGRITVKTLFSKHGSNVYKQKSMSVWLDECKTADEECTITDNITVEL